MWDHNGRSKRLTAYAVIHLKCAGRNRDADILMAGGQKIFGQAMFDRSVREAEESIQSGR